MTQTTFDLRLQLHVDGERMSGLVQGGDDAPRTFSGWLGFVSVLDALIAEAGSPTDDSQPRRTA